MAKLVKSTRAKSSNTSSMKRQLYNFARCALLATTIMGCSTTSHLIAPRAAPISVSRKPTISENQSLYAVMLSDDSGDIIGALQLKTSTIDDLGINFTFVLAVFGKVETISFRKNFDGSTAGDLRALEFFGGDSFTVLKENGTVDVQFDVTITRGLESYLKKGSCPFSRDPRMKCA
ncbi:MAG: hypothetical protein ABH983_05925 [Candidatus Micrarchaeota archaeon]|nr:hypothetical protein [Candidatus Micrarchaeota archaeon]